MKNEKGITLIALLVIIILVFIGILLFKIVSSENSNTYSDVDITDLDMDTDKKNESNDAALLIGSWITDNEPHIVYTFYEDGTGTIGGEGMNEMGMTYTIKSKKLSVRYTGSNSVTETDYSFKDGKLHIGFNIICSRLEE